MSNCADHQQRVTEPIDCGSMARDVREIKTALLGNEKFGQRGLIAQQADHHRRIKKIERWYIYITGAVCALTIMYTVVRDFWPHK